MIDRDASSRTVPDPAARAMLDSLVRGRGLQTFAYFFVTGEGEVLPNGVEAASGHVIDDSGHIYRFWTGWNGEAGQPWFRIWKPTTPEPRWDHSAEYQRARQEVGLCGGAGQPDEGDTNTP